jgi:hypothetical protein
MKEPTIKEVLELVSFERDGDGTLYLIGVRGSVWGNVQGNVRGNVCGDVSGYVLGTIHGRKWQLIETPKEKAIRLIREGNVEEAIQVLQEGE